MATRIIFVFGAIVLAMAVYYTFKLWQMRKLSQQFARTMADASKPTLLYFRSDNCTVCPTQTQYITKAAQQWNGRIAIQKIDAEREPSQANKYNVFTLPTTIIVDTQGKVREINYGLTQPHKLTQQFQGII